MLLDPLRPIRVQFQPKHSQSFPLEVSRAACRTPASPLDTLFPLPCLSRLPLGRFRPGASSDLHEKLFRLGAGICPTTSHHVIVTSDMGE